MTVALNMQRFNTQYSEIVQSLNTFLGIEFATTDSGQSRKLQDLTPLSKAPLPISTCPICHARKASPSPHLCS